jgi:hypothetical protein
MALPTPVDKDFDVSPLPDRPGVLAVFRPTDSHFVFTVVTDPADRARVGPISPAYQVHHRRTGDLGGYASAEALKVAQRRATVIAEKILRGA